MKIPSPLRGGKGGGWGYFRMKNIILIGFMGSGKTEVGKVLAERLGYSLVDTDRIIEKKIGKSISDIFRENGEDYFREIEAGVVRELSNVNGYVISTGGGIIMKKENILNLKKGGLMVWLKSSPETIYERVKFESHRPLLNVENPLEEIKRLLGVRERFYAEADISIDTDALDAAEIVDIIIEAYDQVAGVG